MAGKEGRSGKAETPWAAALKLTLNEVDPASGKRKLRRLAEVTVDLALGGDRDAIERIANRLDGRPAQAVSLDVHDDTGDGVRELLARFAAAQLRAQAAIGVIVDGGASALPDGSGGASGVPRLLYTPPMWQLTP